MTGRVMLLSNHAEIVEHDAMIEKYGVDEAKLLGICTTPPDEQWVSRPFIFNKREVDAAWVLESPSLSINIKMKTGDVWTLEYSDKMWDDLTAYFESKSLIEKILSIFKLKRNEED